MNRQRSLPGCEKSAVIVERIPLASGCVTDVIAFEFASQVISAWLVKPVEINVQLRYVFLSVSNVNRAAYSTSLPSGECITPACSRNLPPRIHFATATPFCDASFVNTTSHVP